MRNFGTEESYLAVLLQRYNGYLDGLEFPGINDLIVVQVAYPGVCDEVEASVNNGSSRRETDQGSPALEDFGRRDTLTVS
jgi:hypothetical protein